MNISTRVSTGTPTETDAERMLRLTGEWSLLRDRRIQNEGGIANCQRAVDEACTKSIEACGTDDTDLLRALIQAAAEQNRLSMDAAQLNIDEVQALLLAVDRASNTSSTPGRR